MIDSSRIRGKARAHVRTGSTQIALPSVPIAGLRSRIEKAEVSMKFCNKCGARLADEAEVCSSCGALINGGAQSAVADSQMPQDLERYQQLLALKAQKDAEEAQAKAEYALQQAAEARQRAQMARQQYQQNFRNDEAVRQEQPAEPTEKKKTALLWILGSVAVLAALTFVAVAFWDNIAGLFEGNGKRTNSRLSDDSTIESANEPVNGPEDPQGDAAWSVIGDICGTNWNTDFPMTKIGDEYRSDLLEIHRGEQILFRKDGSWTDYIGDNGQVNGDVIVFTASGRYYLYLQVAADGSYATLRMELIERIEDTDENPEVPALSGGWSVIGSFCGTEWDTDFPMTEISDGVFASEIFELHAGDELKCRKDGSWDENMGVDGYNGANLSVASDGTYCVILDLIAETIYLEKP